MKFTTLLNYHLIDDVMLISISLLDDLILGFCYKSLTKETSGFEFGSTTNLILQVNRLTKCATHPKLSYILAELNTCVKDCFSDCWKVSFVVTVFENVKKRSTAKIYHPISLLRAFSKTFEKL